MYFLFFKAIALNNVGSTHDNSTTRNIEQTNIPVPVLKIVIRTPSNTKRDKTNDVFNPTSTLLKIFSNSFKNKYARIGTIIVPTDIIIT